MFDKLFKSGRDLKDSQRVRGITAPEDEPHSLVDEVFSWTRTQQTREQILNRGKSATHITTPKMQGR